MNKKSKYLIATAFFILLLTICEIIYLHNFKTLRSSDIKDKATLLSLTALPDLAISTEAMYIRHRSLADTFSIFKESPELREYFPSTFVYSYSHILANTPSKVNNGK